MKPFLKWAGNKYQIIERIKATLPKGNRLIEPFLGSGAVFINTDYNRYLLNDINKDVINLYRTLQTEGTSFISFCKHFFVESNNNESRYYELRDEFNKTKDIRLKSALFLYFNKHGYNGLCRYNQSGGFNVPFGRYKKPYFPEKEMLYFWEKSRNAVFTSDDFVTIMEQAEAGDVVYCDPPYVPLSSTSNFTSYSSNGFGIKEQKLLAEMAKKLAYERGVTVLISNHETEFVMEEYKPARIQSFSVQRYISCDGTNRNKVGEILALFNGGAYQW